MMVKDRQRVAVPHSMHRSAHVGRLVGAASGRSASQCDAPSMNAGRMSAPLAHPLATLRPLSMRPCFSRHRLPNVAVPHAQLLPSSGAHDRMKSPVTLAAALFASLCIGGCTQRTATPPVAPDATSPAKLGSKTAIAAGDATPPASSPKPPAERIDALVDAFLREQYAEGFDPEHQCWKTHDGDGADAVAYCMRVLPPTVVDEGGSFAIYVALASAADIVGDTQYRYSAVDPGMMDAFRLNVGTDGRTSLSASTRGLEFGSVGDCGCADADFVALGPDVHGWAFSSGVTQQGETSSTHALVAPLNGAFRDVAAIPEYVEGDRAIEYRLAIDDDGGASDGWFPLTISKYRNGQKVESRTAAFDAKAGRYTDPSTF